MPSKLAWIDGAGHRIVSLTRPPSLALEAGVAPRIVQRVLGHRHARDTEYHYHYLHSTDDERSRRTAVPSTPVRRDGFVSPGPRHLDFDGARGARHSDALLQADG